MFEREVNESNVTQADLVVGLASYKEADNIAFPAKQASEGLKKYYGDQSSAIVNCDNCSPDDTEGAFLSAETEVPKIYITTPPDTPGKGYNFENMFRKIVELDSEVLVCVDADLLSITPEWIKYFVDPIKEGYDFVNPIYSRHKYDGTITNNICYPIIYGLFGKNIRQPIGGDFALSRRFAEHLILQPWHRTTEEYGVDIFMTMNAIMGGFKTCNTGLGAKVHKPSAPKLGPMFIQVVSTAFLTVIRNFDKWKSAGEIEESKLYGLQEMDPPQDLDVDRTVIEKQSRDGFIENQGELEKLLSPDAYKSLVTMYSGSDIDVDTDLWIRIVFDMIASFKTTSDRGALLEAFKSLYFGRTLTFMNETWDMSSEKAEELILAQAEAFRAKRDYLIEKLG
ncbi:hypothetical protein BVX97_06285 [bacterium E08(2017)]|nr:hypothetical protein BVX97_06285 [bacterium E08(2017)]